MNNITINFPFKLEIFVHFFIISDEELGETIILNKSKIIRIRSYINDQKYLIEILSDSNNKVILCFDEETEHKIMFINFLNYAQNYID